MANVLGFGGYLHETQWTTTELLAWRTIRHVDVILPAKLGDLEH